MKRILLLVSLLTLSAVSCFCKKSGVLQSTDLTPYWDFVRPITNPDKGWYHHMLDNGVHKYLIEDDKHLASFRGMGHLYLRPAWAFIEPKEGEYDWSYIDNIVDKYVPMGYGVCFRISCKETGLAPNRVHFATPYWVVEAGANGIGRPEFGTTSWTPDYADPIFLEKLENFHKAFAAKYDGKPWVRDIDVGSVGEWGEGHTFFSTRIPAPVELIKQHMDMHKRCYKHSLPVVTDDLLSYGKSDQEKNTLLNYAIRHGFTLRDDKVKANGNWVGVNGEGYIPNTKITSADVFRNSLKIMEATYIGFHGYIDQWQSDNPQLTNELLNMCGYWYFPKTVSVKELNNQTVSFEIDWLNRGVAPAYNRYQLKGVLIPLDNTKPKIDFCVDDSQNMKWQPDSLTKAHYQITLKDKPQGKYKLAIQLFDLKTDQIVDIALDQALKQDDFHTIQEINL